EPGKGRPLVEGLATPRDAVELKLTEIWESVLDVQPIGIEDKFFDLGGHSLLAVKLTAQIEKVFGPGSAWQRFSRRRPLSNWQRSFARRFKKARCWPGLR